MESESCLTGFITPLVPFAERRIIEMKKRILSLLLCCIMLVGLLPTAVFAEGESSHKHPSCGASCTHTGTDPHADVIWTAWTATDSLPNEAGNYYLAENVILSATWLPAQDTMLCGVKPYIDGLFTLSWSCF